MNHWPPTPAPHGLFVPLAAGIKSRVDRLFHRRITDPAMANNIIERGDADMVGMTRVISDPNLVQILVAHKILDLVSGQISVLRKKGSKPYAVCTIQCLAGKAHGANLLSQKR